MHSLTNARIFLFIYTHSQDDHGDLYYGDDNSSPSVRMVCYARVRLFGMLTTYS